jgi:hypothetical protein
MSEEYQAANLSASRAEQVCPTDVQRLVARFTPHILDGPTPSMRRPVEVKTYFAFFFP